MLVLRLLLPVTVFLCIFWRCVPYVLQLSPDIGWLVATGDYIRKHHSHVPPGDIFSWTNPKAPWVAYQWLYEVLVSWLGSIDGLWLVGAFTYVLAGVLLGFVLPMQWIRQGIKPWLALLAVCFCINENFFFARPQTISFYLIVILVSLLEQHRKSRNWRVLMLLPFLMILWANLHSFWLVGLFIMAVYTVFAESNKARMEIGSCLAVSLPCLLINPYGSELINYMLHYPGQTDYRINELLPAFPPHTIYGYSFLAFAFFSTLMIFIKWRYLPAAGVVLSVVSTGAALFMTRYEVLAVLLNWPFLASALLSFKQPLLDILKTRCRLNLKTQILWFVAAAILPLLLWCNRIPTEIEAEESFNGGSTWNMNFIGTHFPKEERLFCDPSTGSRLLYFGVNKVFIDSRFDMYGKDFYTESFQILDAQEETKTQKGWQTLLSNRGASGVLLQRSFSKLEEALQDSDNWLLVYADLSTSLWLTNTKEHQENLKQWELEGEDPAKLNLPVEAKAQTADLRRSKRLVSEGEQLTKAGKYAEAADSFKAAIGATSHSAAAHHGLIHAYAVLQDRNNLHDELALAGPLFFKEEIGNVPIDEWVNVSTEKLLNKYSRGAK